MDKNLWINSAKERFQGTEFKPNIEFDIIIIGGGYTGLSAALEAATQGAKVAVLEAQTVGYGGSGRNVGLVNAGLWLPPETVSSTMGQDAGDRLNRALAVAPQKVFENIRSYEIDCEPVQNGTLHCAHAPSGMKNLEDRFSQLKKMGAPVTLLDAAQSQERTGSGQVYGALHDARAGTIQPLSYARGLARSAQSVGAEIYEQCCVTDVQQDGQGWQVHTTNGTVQAAKLVMATNAYHQHTHAPPIPKVTSVNFFQLATDPLPRSLAETILPQREGCWDTAMLMSSFRMDAAKRFIIGGIGKPDGLNIHYSYARRMMAHLFPQLSAQKLNHAWSGRISMTQDHIPKLLRLGRSSMSENGAAGYAMFGYSGRGIGPGTIMGQAIAKSLLSGSEQDLPLEPVDQFHEMLPSLREGFYETGARVLHSIGRRV